MSDAESPSEKLKQKKYAGLKPIKPGQVLNPNGARAHSFLTKALRNANHRELQEVVQAALLGKMEELEEYVKDSKGKQPISYGIAKILLASITNEDWVTFEKIFERITGKVPIIIEARDAPPEPQVILTMPANGREIK